MVWWYDFKYGTGICMEVWNIYQAVSVFLLLHWSWWAQRCRSRSGTGLRLPLWCYWWREHRWAVWRLSGPAQPALCFVPSGWKTPGLDSPHSSARDCHPPAPARLPADWGTAVSLKTEVRIRINTFWFASFIFLLRTTCHK